MRVLIASLGSRGDVEPFLILAEALAARGHQVCVALDEGYRELASSAVRFTPLGDLHRVQLVDIVRRALPAATPNERGQRAFKEFYFDRKRDVLGRLRAVLGRPGEHFDVLVLNEIFVDGEPNAVEWAGPVAVVSPTLIPDRDLIALAEGRPALRLAALSPLFCPEDPRIKQAWTYTGFWTRPRSCVVPEVDEFLAPDRPFMVTMGSMTGFDGAALAASFVKAARAVGRRLILQRGPAGLDVAAARDVLVVDRELDYATLALRVEAMFCHGGTGTLASILAAGRPVAILPLTMDQTLWARVLGKLGCAVATLDPFAPSATHVEHAMRRAIADERAAQAARRLAEMMAHDRGVVAACEAIERLS